MLDGGPYLTRNGIVQFVLKGLVQPQGGSTETNIFQWNQRRREIGGRKDQTKKFKLLQLLLHPRDLEGQIFLKRIKNMELEVSSRFIWGKMISIWTHIFQGWNHQAGFYGGLTFLPVKFPEAGTPPDPSKVPTGRVVPWEEIYKSTPLNVQPAYKALVFGMMKHHCLLGYP